MFDNFDDEFNNEDFDNESFNGSFDDEDVDFGEILGLNNLSEEDVRKLEAKLEKEVDEIIRRLNEDKVDDEEYSSKYTCSSRFNLIKSINIQNGKIKFTVTSSDECFDVIFDFEKCHTDNVLTQGRKYDFVISDIEGEKYIIDYSEVRSHKRRRGFSGFEDALKDTCCELLPDGPKVDVTFEGIALETEGCDEGIKCTIHTGNDTYENCIIPHRISSIIPDVEEGEIYQWSCILGSGGCAYIYTLRKKDFDCEAYEHKTIEGKVQFVEVPDPESKEFRFKIIAEDKEYDAKIDRYSNRCESPLRDKSMYAFSCVGKKELEIHRYKEKLKMRDLMLLDVDTIEDSDEKLFCRECIEKEGAYDYSLIGVPLIGRPVNLVNEGLVYRFEIFYKNINYKCVFDSSFHHISKINTPDENKNYIFDGVLVGRSVYINAMYEFNNEEFADNISSEFFGFFKLEANQKDEVMNIINSCENFGLIDPTDVPAFQSTSEMEEKYRILRNYYPKEVQCIIENALRSNTLRQSHKDKIFECMINTVWGRRLSICVDYKYIKEKLDQKFYGQEYLKKEIIKIFLDYKYKTNRKRTSILLVGPPGVGKTSMFRYAAQVMHIPFEKISLNGVDNPESVIGSSRIYENATCGSVIDAIHKVGDKCVIMLDEVDKMVCSKNSDPVTALYNLLDSNELFADNFIAQGIDISNVILVLTANDSSVLPAAILDRVYEVFVPDYTAEEKNIIAGDYVIKDEMANYNLEGKSIKWCDDVIDDVANKYTLSDGVRDIEKNVASIIRSALQVMNEDETDEITVSKSNVMELLDIPPCSREVVVHDIAGLRNKFKYFKYAYSEPVRCGILQLFSKYNTTNDPYEKEMIRKKLGFVVNIVPDRSESTYDLVKVKKMFDESHYGMEEAKQTILSYLAAYNLNTSTGAACLLLDGPYGVGKTTVCEIIAKAADRKFIKVSLNGVDKSGFIKGFESTWKDATAGKIAEELSNAGTDKVVVLLDEIDKMGTGSINGNPYSALLDLLDDSATFTDLFVGIPIDVSNILFVATSNDLSNVPVSIKDRMEVIHLSGYSENDKIHIAENYVARKKLDKYKLDDDVFSDGTIKNIVSDYCKSFGVRDVDKAIDKVLREYVKEVQFGSKCEKIDDDFVQKILGAKPLKRGNVAEETIPGIARALAVSGNHGTTFAVQVTENPYGQSDEITGLPKQSTIDSVKISKLLISKMLKRELPMLHVHFGEGGIEKDGPSAGITIFAALFSCITGIGIDSKIGMTGEVDIFGSLWPIGGLEQKIIAAENEGCTKVLVPYANYQQLVEENKLGNYKCMIIPVSSVHDVCDLLFKSHADC